MTMRSTSTHFQLRLGTCVALGALTLAAAFGCSSSDDPSAGGSAGAPTSNTGGAHAAGATASAGAPAGGAPAASAGASNGGAPTTSGGSANAGAGGASAGASSAGAPSTGGAPATSGGSGGKGGSSGGTATAGSAGAAGGSNTGTYNPCPTNGDPCKILPLGDSITWGIQYEGAYRVELFSKAVAAGQKITFTGSLSDGPAMAGGVAFPKSNEGHSGWTIDQDAGLVPSPAFTTIPNIVLLLIGTNDVYASSGQAAMPTRLGSLMDKIFAAAPDALLVVAKITPLGGNATWNATIKTYNDAMPALIQTKAAAGKHVIGIDLNTGFMVSSMLSSDNIHPNKTGYDWMGDTWYTAISQYLPK